jgi:hypothetical protein
MKNPNADDDSNNFENGVFSILVQNIFLLAAKAIF